MTVAVGVLVGALCIINLLLTYGVIGRLREHSAALSRLGGGLAAPPGVEPVPSGTRVGDFAAVTTDGVPVTRDRLAADSVVAFLSADCRPCKEQLPRFIEFAAAFPNGRDRLLAVVVGTVESTAPTVTQLAPAVPVVVTGGADGGIVQAFAVTRYPAFVVLDGDSMVRTSGYTVAALPVAGQA